MQKNTWIELDQSAFNHNVSQFKQVLGPTQLGIVVKANAYGHGMFEVAQMAEINPQVAWYFVAQLSEALQLRAAGFKKPILVFGCINAPLETAIKKDISLAVYDIETIEQLQAIGKAHNYIFPIHIKIDTGLSRLGIDPNDAIPFIQKVLTCSHIAIEGIYSHFAESHKTDNSYTLQQVAIFKKVIDALQELKITIPFIHLANSAASTMLSLPFCNLARVGVGVYGLWSSAEMKEYTQLHYPGFNLHPILGWKTCIMHIKKVTANSFIGYDRTFRAPHDMILAMIPIGYSDGYDFRLFNQSSMIINNQYARVVGRIAMNITCLDVTAIAHVNVNDEVIIMGNYPHIHPAELGLLAGNPNVREITTKINPSIPRMIINKLDLEQNQKLFYTNLHR